MCQGKLTSYGFVLYTGWYSKFLYVVTDIVCRNSYNVSLVPMKDYGIISRPLDSMIDLYTRI